MSIFEVQTPQESVGFQFWKLHQQWQKRVNETLKPFQITHTQFVIMASIAWFEEQKVQPYQSQVSSLMNLDKMAFSKAVRQLESQGYVLREKSKQDGRAMSLSLTNKALETVPKAMQAIENVDKGVFGKLGGHKKTFNQILLMLNKHLAV
jgi:DNA-binding MarR family transcriptional regulator